MDGSRLVDISHGGQRARRAWRSLRKEVNADLERQLRHQGRWAAIQELLDYAIDREPSEEVDVYLLAAAHLLKKLARATHRPMARAGCRGISAAICIRLGRTDAARTSVQQATATLRRAIKADTRAMRGARRRTKYHDALYRQRYLGNEVMALLRFLDEELIVLDGRTSAPRKPSARKPSPRKPSPRKPYVRKGRAMMPSWDEILFGVDRVDGGARATH